ncbi:MAG: DUF2007 domain-containing protein [Candidatus Brocadiaceae bacterium]|nr:DUF2007 domain-containing protein [Candidatus Brocadiaceae bacterium]
MPQDEELVTVYETDMQGRVAVLKMALQNEGIPFLCDNEVLSGVLPIDGMAVVSFQVRPCDVERAGRVLDELGFA